MKKPFQIFLLPSHPLHFHPEEQCLQEGGRRVHGGLTSSQLRHMEVGFFEILLQGVFFFYLAPLSHLQFSPQGTAATVSSTIEDYLRLPLEQYKCLRFAIMN